MELKWFEDLVALTRFGSFSRAAEERHISQPALSRRIRSLEEWLGATLVNRNSTPISLTAKGEEFLPHALEIIRNTTAIRDDIRATSTAERNEVRIASLHTLTVWLVPDLISGFVSRHPDAAVSLLPHLQAVDSYFDALKRDAAHIVIAYAQQRPALPHSAELLYKTVAQEEFLPVGAPALLAKLGTTDLDRLQRAIPVIAWNPWTFTYTQVGRFYEHLGKLARTVVVAPLAETHKALALRGIGITWLPKRAIRDELANGQLIVVKGDKSQRKSDIHAWRNKDLSHERALHFWSELS